MKKLVYALATIALLAEPAIALPIDPMPAPPAMSESQVVPVALGHHRRVARRSMRRTQRVIRRTYIRRNY
jgi:hypothetical protein